MHDHDETGDETRLPTRDRRPAGERRGAPRSPTSYNAACRIGNVRYIVEVRDVSRTGARIHVRQGLMPLPGRMVSLSFMDGQVVAARVVWTRDGEAGLELAEPLPDGGDAAHFDELGRDYYRAILRFQLASE
jgi:hypothetical protein